MGVTFNVTDQLQGGIGANGLYAHITDIAGPKRDPTINVGSEGAWYVTYGLKIHKDQSTRNSDTMGWPNAIQALGMERRKWLGPNLDTYPTMAVLYAHYKTSIASIASSIADAI